MYYLECQCRFRNVWNEVENVAPFVSLVDAQWGARQMAINKRTAVRVVDDDGNVWFTAAFPFRS